MARKGREACLWKARRRRGTLHWVARRGRKASHREARRRKGTFHWMIRFEKGASHWMARRGGACHWRRERRRPLWRAMKELVLSSPAPRPLLVSRTSVSRLWRRTQVVLSSWMARRR